MRHRLMIVDDEDSIRNGMAKSIPWESWGYEICALCANGKEAVDKIDEAKPDVVLSDIRMPIMDGVALMKWLHENRPEIKIVILSGYNDYEYLNMSIKNQVTDYLLKPTDLDEFEELFRRLYRQICDEKNRNRKVQDSVDYHFTEWMKHLIRGTASPEETERFLPETPRRGICLTNCVLALFRADDRAGEEQSSLNRFRTQVHSLWKQMELPVRFFSGTYEDNMLAGIFSMPEEQLLSEEQVLESCRMLQEEVRTKLGSTVSAGLSDLATEVAMLPQAREQALYCLRQTVFTGAESRLIYPRLNLQYPEQTEYFSAETIESCLLDGDYDGMCAEVDRVWNGFTRGPMRQYRVVDHLLLSLLFTIALWALRYDVHMEQVLRSLGVTYEDVYFCDTLEKKRNFLCAVLFAVQLQLDRQRYQSKRGASLAYQMRELIEREFDNNEMSLEYIADRLHKHPSYISKVFKKELGRCFNDYLNRLRIEKAERLLVMPDYKVYEIAQECGYVDTSHFNRVFRKYKGVSPSEYRADGGNE